MNVNVETLEKNKVKLEIEVGADILEEGLNKSYKRNAKRFNIPGFRKGRAPRFMVERQYGVEALYPDAAELICEEYYPKAIDENKIEPVDRPELDIVELERGKPFVFSAVVTIKPEVRLGAYTGVEAEYKTALVTDDDIEERLKSEADKNARLVPVEDRPSQSGDTLLIDYEGFIDGAPFEGGKREGHNLEIGSKSFIDDFEEQLIGRNAGDAFKISVRFPDDYHKADVQGKDAEFNVTIHTIKRKELPAIDDEFAQDVSEYESLDEYKAAIRKELTEEQEKISRQNFENQLIKKIVDEAQIDIPEVMIERQIDQNYKNFEMMMAYQGLSPEQYFAYSSTTPEQVREDMRERSVNEVRTTLVLERIGADESIEVTDEEMDAELLKRAEARKKTPDEYKADLSEDLAKYIRSNLKSQKIVSFLVDGAKRV